MNIKELIATGASVTIAVTPMDLKEFAMAIMEETKAMIAAESERNAGDVVLSVTEAARQLHKTKNTLWRWERDGYLIPVSRVGNSPRYLQSQIDAILKGGAA